MQRIDFPFSTLQFKWLTIKVKIGWFVYFSKFLKTNFLHFLNRPNKCVESKMQPLPPPPPGGEMYSKNNLLNRVCDPFLK